MQQIQVHFDSMETTPKTYTTYNIDWGGFTAMSEYTEIYNDTKTFPGIENPVDCITFYQSNSDFGAYIPNLPTTETDTNTLNNYPNTFTYDGEYNSDYYSNPNNYDQLTVGTMPDDWGKNPHYMRFDNSYSPRDNKRVNSMLPVSMNEPWNNAEQYYLDKTGKIVQSLFFPNNYRFTTSKGGVFSGTGVPASYKASICGGAYTFEPFIDTTPFNFYRTYYVITQDINGSTDISMSTPGTDYDFHSRSLFTAVNLRAIDDDTITYNVFISATINGVEYTGLASIVYNTDTGKYTDIGGFLLTDNFWKTGEIPPEPPAPDWGDDTTTGGGVGTHTIDSDNVGDASGDYFDNPSTGLVVNINTNISTALALNKAGGFNIHQIIPDHMRYIYGELYTTDYFANWTNTMFNPLSAILNVHMLPPEFITDAATLNSSHLTAAGYDISAKIATHHPDESGNVDYAELNAISHYHVGALSLPAPGVFNAFPDFAPYTTAVLHLPYIGQIDIDINAIMYGEISIDYVCDITNGNCTAFVWCYDHNGVYSYKYVASGNCSYSIPLYAYNQDGSAIQKMLNSAGAMIAGGLSGNVATMGGGIAGIADSMLDMKMTKRDTQFTGTLSGNNSMLTDGRCFLEITRPVWANPKEYQNLYGETSELSGTLKADNYHQTPYNGFTIVSEIDLDSVTATPEEKREIDELLKAGVYIRGELL